MREPVKLDRVLDCDPSYVLSSQRMKRAGRGFMWMVAIGAICLLMNGVLDAEAPGRLGRAIGRFETMGWLCLVFGAGWYAMAFVREASKP